MDRDDVLISSILPMLPLAVSSISRFPLPLSLTFFQKSLHWALNLSVGFFGTWSVLASLPQLLFEAVYVLSLFPPQSRPLNLGRPGGSVWLSI